MQIACARCVALDGLDRPSRGPITLALTTASEFELSPTATRPGRLSPRLDLGLPDADERRLILERAISGLPTQGTIDLEVVIQRTGGWSGAEIATALEEAMSRSLLDRTDALTSSNLLEVLADHYLIEDPLPRRKILERRIALHEAGHVLLAHHFWPSQVSVASLRGPHPSTQIDEAVFQALARAVDLRRLAAMSLGGLAAEIVVFGLDGVTGGGAHDRAMATQWLVASLEAAQPYDGDVLESGQESDRGSERMQASAHEVLERESSQLLGDTVAQLLPLRPALEHLADAMFYADEQTLSGEALQSAIEAAHATA